MDDAGTRQRGQRRRMMEECVEEGAVAVATAGMNDQSRRLVDDEDGVVFMNDRKIDRLRRVDKHRRFDDRGHDDSLPSANALLAFGDRAVERDMASIDPILEPAARMLRAQPRERLIESEPR